MGFQRTRLVEQQPPQDEGKKYSKVADLAPDLEMTDSPSGKPKPAVAVPHSDRHDRATPPVSPCVLGGRATAPALSAGLDDMGTGRAAAVYQAESNKWDAMIEAVANDFGLLREQRFAAIAALRMRQQAAAKGAQQLIMDEEKGKVKAYRRSQQSAAPLARYRL